MSEGLRKKLVYATLPLAIIWAVYNYPTTPKKAPVSPPLSQAIQPQPEPAGAPDTRFIDIEQETGKSWGKDPFRSYRSRKQPERTVKEHHWVLRGIVYSDEDPLAFINRESVRVGDLVDKARVVAIDRKSVTLDHNGQQIKLDVNKG
jgi:hypothetical protein